MGHVLNEVNVICGQCDLDLYEIDRFRTWHEPLVQQSESLGGVENGAS